MHSASEIRPKQRRTATFTGFKFERICLFLPLTFVSTVSVNFCIGSVMNYVALEDTGSERIRVTETIA